MTRTVFHGGSVFDGTGADLAEADVVVEDGTIIDVGRGFDCHVDLAGRYDDDELTLQHRPFSYGFFLIPENLRITLALGITTVRDAGGTDAGLRKAVEDGVLVGPRMQVSITMLSQTG